MPQETKKSPFISFIGKEINLSIVYLTFGIIAIFILFHTPIARVINLVLVDPILSYCPVSVLISFPPPPSRQY